MQKNMALLWKIYDHIQEQEDRKGPGMGDWNQSTWAGPVGLAITDLPGGSEVRDVADALGVDRSWDVRVLDPNLCGTAFCVAGHAVNMTHNALFLIRNGRGTADTYLDLVTCQEREVAAEAARLLGLTEGEAEELFESGNTVDRIYGILMDYEREEAARI